MSENESNIDAENEYEKKRELLRHRELTDEEVERIADVTSQKDPRDRYERKVVPVTIEDGEVKIGDVVRIGGQENVRWKDKVIGTFGAGGTTPDEVRQAYRDAKARWIKGLYNDEQIAREFGDLE